jgi:putative FmdB family regulatory protein
VPIYDYVCSSCKHRVEVIHGINVAGPHVCPNCGQEGTMRRAFSTPAVHFKGSGWAKKDRSSASGTRTKGSASSSAGSGDSSSNGSGSSDSGSGDKGSGGAGDSGSKASGDSSTSSSASTASSS